MEVVALLERRIFAIMVKHSCTERERRERRETFIHSGTGDETSNPDDLNTRFIQINNQLFSLNNGGLL